MDYCNIFFLGLPEKEISKLSERIQESATRLIT